MTWLLVFAGFLAWDPNFTPGILCTPQSRDFMEYAYPEGVPKCKRRYLTPREKRIVGDHYGVEEKDFHHYQFDHLIALCLGGDNGPRNVWPLLLPEAMKKDDLAKRLCTKMRRGEITQAYALSVMRKYIDDNLTEYSYGNDSIATE